MDSEERMHKLRNGSDTAKWAADRISELEAQLKTAKRDAILEAVSETAYTEVDAHGNEIHVCQTHALYDFSARWINNNDC